MDDTFNTILRRSMKTNAEKSLKPIDTLICQAKGIMNTDELRNNEELYYFSKRIIFELNRTKSLLQMMKEDL